MLTGMEATSTTSLEGNKENVNSQTATSVTAFKSSIKVANKNKYNSCDSLFYSCKICGDSSNDLEKVKGHVSKKHKILNPTTENYSPSFRKIVRVNGNNCVYQCIYCDTTNEYKQFIVDHVKHAHNFLNSNLIKNICIPPKEKPSVPERILKRFQPPVKVRSSNNPKQETSKLCDSVSPSVSPTADGIIKKKQKPDVKPRKVNYYKELKNFVIGGPERVKLNVWGSGRSNKPREDQTHGQSNQNDSTNNLDVTVTAKENAIEELNHVNSTNMQNASDLEARTETVSDCNNIIGDNTSQDNLVIDQDVSELVSTSVSPNCKSSRNSGVTLKRGKRIKIYSKATNRTGRFKCNNIMCIPCSVIVNCGSCPPCTNKRLK